MGDTIVDPGTSSATFSPSTATITRAPASRRSVAVVADRELADADWSARRSQVRSFGAIDGAETETSAEGLTARITDRCEYRALPARASSSDNRLIPAKPDCVNA